MNFLVDFKEGKILKTVIVINRNGMGDAPEELGYKLVQTHLSLLQGEWLPSAICLYAEGVKLTVNGSPVLDQLQELSQQGVLILICSTCLNYYGLIDEVVVGTVGGMNDIMDVQHHANKVITL